MRGDDGLSILLPCSKGTRRSATRALLNARPSPARVIHIPPITIWKIGLAIQPLADFIGISRGRLPHMASVPEPYNRKIFSSRWDGRRFG